MPTAARMIHGAKFALALVAVMFIAACANKPADQQAGVGGQATPGSQQDFVVNVGDRVFFESDQTDLTSTARARS